MKEAVRQDTAGTAVHRVQAIAEAVHHTEAVATAEVVPDIQEAVRLQAEATAGVHQEVTDDN